MKRELRRTLTGILAMSMMLSLAACGTTDSASSSGSGGAATSDTAADSSTEAAASTETATAAATETAAESSSAAEETGRYTPGTYTASAEGRNGTVTVSVTVDSDSILSVEVTDQQETEGIGDTAVEELPGLIVEAQSTDVDGVSGATITSNAIKEAVNAALSQAQGIDADSTNTAEETATEADVIVLGAGGAGLAAAASAAAEGASVIVLETNSYAGGDTISSGGHMLYIDDTFNSTQPRNDDDLEKYASYDTSDWPDEWKADYDTLMEEIDTYRDNQEETGRFDSVERAMVDHYVKGAGTDVDGDAVSLDYDLIRSAFDANMEDYEWLSENGMEIKDTMYNDHANSPVDGGSSIINAELQAVEIAGAQVQYGVRATGLVSEGSRITGVTATTSEGEVTYTADKAVVIATGGFASNTEKVAEVQKLGTGLNADTPSNDPESIQGDGIWMAEDLGAATRDMQFIMTVLKGYDNGCTLSEAGLITGNAQIAVTADGERFGDETKGMAFQALINDLPDGVAYFVGDQSMIDGMNAAKEGSADDFEERGWLYTGDTLEDAAKKAGLDPEALQAAVDTYNSAVDAGTDEAFGRETFGGKIENGPFCIAKMQQHYHLTFGGLVVNDDMQVLDEDGAVVAENLYAAGDVISGYEGKSHQSGDCLTVVIHGGRTAGANAAK